MAKLNTYLNFNGNTLEAFNFYKSVFGGEFSTLQFYKDIPGGDKMATEDKEKIMHIALPIGKNNMLMATDSLSSANQKLIVGDNFHIAIHADNMEEATALFQALSEGGQITIPLDKTFWGDVLGMLKDKFDIQWIVNFSEPK